MPLDCFQIWQQGNRRVATLWPRLQAPPYRRYIDRTQLRKIICVQWASSGKIGDGLGGDLAWNGDVGGVERLPPKGVVEFLRSLAMRKRVSNATTDLANVRVQY